MFRSPPTIILFLSFILCILSFANASKFHQKIGQHVAAYNKAFHENLLKQLSESKNNDEDFLALVTTTSTSTSTAPSSTSSGGFASGSTSTFQIYVNSTLPTTPPPSAACATALTATIQCNSTVPLMSLSPFVLLSDLPTVCTSTCASSLASYRTNVVSACAGYTISSNNVTYPPTFIADTISGPYNTQCLQDPTTLQFCSPLLTSYNTTGGLLALPTSELCTFCTLETLNTTLSNAATYSAPLVDILSSAVQTCGSSFTKYNVTSPPISPVTPGSATQFGSNATTTSTTGCSLVGRNITVSTASNCAAIAQQYSVSYNDILASNPFLNSNCSIVANSKLCVPQTCTTYTIAVNDTCTSVAASAGLTTGTNITVTQLLSFNPELGTLCQLMSLKVGQTICLTPNGGFPHVSATSVGLNPSATPTAKAAIPTPTPSGTTSNCGRYYLVQEGDICNTVILNNTISFPDFITLNPEINANCTNLWLGYNYCVAPFPPLISASATPVITTNYSSATMLTIPLSTATPTFSTIDVTPAGIPAPTNVANGTRTIACGYYYDVLANDTLASIATEVGVNSSALLTWNPELANAPPTNGSAICVLFPMGNYTLPDATPPTNIAVNTTTFCAQFYTVQPGDGCPSIETEFGISDSLFKSMNPSINSQCTNIILGVAYCVFPDTPLPAQNSSSIPSNLAPGTITAGCTQYYTVVSGDSCPAIDTKFNLTLSQFIAMNPEISSTCNNLALSEAYCVATSNTTTTGPPSNVAPGTITSGCTEYYTVVSGDSCSAIDTKFNLTLAQFIAMNPEISSTCNNLALSEAYCVATSNSTGPPSNVAPGTITSGCTQYYTVVSGDSCSVIDTKFNLNLTQFIAMNPEISSTCNNLALGEAYCVATSNTTTTGPPSNVAPGTITSGCTEYYTIVSGDSCSAVDTKFNLTLSQFIAMNPEITSTCSNLALGEAYCVQSSNSTAPVAPSNLATGSLANCTTYHTVVSGDSCAAMETTFNIAAADFFRWNPEVDIPCTKIFAGEAYCVGGGGSACKKLYTVQSGDTCSKIIASQNITQAQLNSLNPAVVDANCDNLSVGENLCVG